MVICIIAAVIFGFLGIFSAKYRGYAKESFRCTFRMATLRKCDTEFDERVKAKITSKLMKRSPKAAGFVFRNFSVISWVFVIVMFASLALTVNTAYNLAVYGTCDPHSDQCIFNPNAISCGSEHCAAEGCTCDKGCEAPEYTACAGNCTCENETCG
ncbi:MAG: hypothetical protein V1802_01475 [Candidatus Aenigmatarchaeota archaeon]